ncbi:phosphate uptake regulator PhoU [Amycolatopsis sp. H6(2020)]|nr:phosphate uptake regulator PhoU [Amycolatopsis sp. H6(2020)]
MPTAFEKELVTLARRLADLGDLVAIALEEATRSALESDHTLGGRAREQAAAVAALGAACEDQARALPALHAPREAEVKAVVAAVHTAADLTRMGGLAREVAEARGPVSSEVRTWVDGRAWPLGVGGAVDLGLPAAVYGRFAGTAVRVGARLRSLRRFKGCGRPGLRSALESRRLGGRPHQA